LLDAARGGITAARRFLAELIRRVRECADYRCRLSGLT